MSYKHLSLEERYYLEIAKKAGKTLTKIAQDIGRSQSTLSRELIRNGVAILYRTHRFRHYI